MHVGVGWLAWAAVVGLCVVSLAWFVCVCVCVLVLGEGYSWHGVVLGFCAGLVLVLVLVLGWCWIGVSVPTAPTTPAKKTCAAAIFLILRFLKRTGKSKKDSLWPKHTITQT